MAGSAATPGAARGVQTWFARAFTRAAGPVDERSRMAAIRERLTDPHLLPAEVKRLEKLAPTPQPPGGKP